tara:strand:- start:295 stop:651 length:357 start_codon:yes stop_codon:yes gene_type:complete
MSKTPKELILKELRSGGNKQCYKKLKDDEGAYCVLGVILKAYFESGQGCPEPYTSKGRTWWEPSLPTEVGKWAFGEKDEEFSYRNPYVFWAGATASLAELNDEGLNFFELADIIEEQL